MAYIMNEYGWVDSKMASNSSATSYSYIYYDDIGYNQTLLELLQLHQKESPSAFVFAILMTILSAVFNTGIIIAICYTPMLRQNTLYVHIVNISLVNIVMCAYVIPMAIYAELEPWRLGDTMCKVWIILDVLMPFISMVVLLLMNFDRLFVLVCCRSHSWLPARTFVKVILVCVPWLAGCLIVLPMWILGSNYYPYYDGYCIFGLEFGASVASPIITYFLPAVTIILLITLILMYNFKGNLADHNMYSSPSRSVDCQRRDSAISYDEEKHLSLVTLCLADFFFIAMWFPYQLFTLLMSLCTGCYPPVSAAVAFTWLGASTACVIPLTWLSDVKIRESITKCARDLCTRHVRHESRESNNVPLMEL